MTVVKLGDARVIPLPVGEKNGQGVIGNGIGRVLPRDLGKNFFRFPLPPVKPGPQSLPRALVRFRNRRRRLRFFRRGAARRQDENGGQQQRRGELCLFHGISLRFLLRKYEFENLRVMLHNENSDSYKLHFTSSASSVPPNFSRERILPQPLEDERGKKRTAKSCVKFFAAARTRTTNPFLSKLAKPDDTFFGAKDGQF